MDLTTSAADSSSPVSSYAGAILLDVENFALKLNLGQYLKGFCQYPIMVKFAVANWQNSSVAKLDKHLHSLGYQLIHVPKAKNAADAQIMTLGAALPLNYPQVKEVVIVSHDAIFNYLHQSLQRQGINTYKVYQKSGNVHIVDMKGDRNSIITKVAESKSIPTIEQQISSKIELTLAELIHNSADKVSLSNVCQEFKRKYKKTISETLKSNKLPKSTLNFIKQSCADKIKVEIDNKGHILSFKSS